MARVSRRLGSDLVPKHAVWRRPARCSKEAMISAADFDDVFGPRARQNRAASSTAPLEPGALQAEDEEVEAALVLREGVDHRADDYPSPSRRRLRDLRRIARSRVNQHL